MSTLSSIVLWLDKIADKEVANIKTLQGWLTECNTIITQMPAGVAQTVAEQVISSIVPVVNLVAADLTPIATALDKAVAANSPNMTAAQAAQIATTAAAAVAAAYPQLGAAISTAAAGVEASVGGH